MPSLDSWLWVKPIRHEIAKVILLALMVILFVPIMATGTFVLAGLKRHYHTGVWYVDMTPMDCWIALLATVAFAVVVRLYYRYIL